MPKVSVIIPTHNRSELIKTAIFSVLNQTMSDWELITIDDHSTDQTEKVIKSIKDNRIKYLYNRGKNGPSTSRNLGISNASGKYIAFLDDDDEWVPGKLEKQIGLLDSCLDEICGVYSNRLMIDKNTGESYSEDPGAEILKGNLLSQLIVKNPIHTSTLIVRKKCFEKTGLFDETMRYMEDRDLFLRLAMHWEFEYIDEPLTKAYYHGKDHLSTNLEGQTNGREILLKKYEHLIKKDRKIWGYFHICLGTQYCQLGKIKIGRKNLIKGIKIYPLYKIAYLHYLSSFLGSANYKRIRKMYKKSLSEFG